VFAFKDGKTIFITTFMFLFLIFLEKSQQQQQKIAHKTTSFPAE
jgi:hypothetical protein